MDNSDPQDAPVSAEDWHAKRRDDDALRAAATRIGLSSDMLTLCVREFVRREHRRGKLRKPDAWTKALQGVVERNAYGLWFVEADGRIAVTSRGRQATKLHGGEVAKGSAVDESKRWAAEQQARADEVRAARAARGGSAVPEEVAEALARMGVKRKAKDGAS